MNDNETIITTLSDNANQKVWQCYGHELLRCFDALFIYDVDAKELQKSGKISEKDVALLTNGKSHEFWKKMPSTTKKRKFDEFKELLAKHSTTKSKVRQLLSDKIKFITKSPFETFEDYVTYHQKNGMKSPFIGTSSPISQNDDFGVCTKALGISSPIVKVGSYAESQSQTINNELTERKGIIPSSNENGNIDLIIYVKKFIEKKKEERKTDGYCNNCNSLLSYLERYNDKMIIKQINISQVDNLYIEGFSEFLRTIISTKTKRELSERTRRLLIDILNCCLKPRVSRQASPVKEERVDNPIDDDPFDPKRSRVERNKKETKKQYLNRISSYVSSTYDQILLGIANGSIKFKWKNIAKECGYGNGEKKKMLSLLNNNKGYTIEELAHANWEDNDGNYGHTDVNDIRNEIIDILQKINSPADALNELERRLVEPPF